MTISNSEDFQGFTRLCMQAKDLMQDPVVKGRNLTWDAARKERTVSIIRVMGQITATVQENPRVVALPAFSIMRHLAILKKEPPVMEAAYQALETIEKLRPDLASQMTGMGHPSERLKKIFDRNVRYAKLTKA